MTRRSGVTLVEVLVAIFVMALGLMALLTLFPLGALRMAQAIKDDRTKYAADNGQIIARVWWRDIWTDPTTNHERTYQAALNLEPFIGALDDNTAPVTNSGPAGVPPFQPGPPTGAPALTVSPFSPLPSIPVFLDPVGYMTPRGPDQFWVGGAGTNTGSPQTPGGVAAPGRFGGIPRRTKAIAGNPSPQAGVLKLCMLPDDMEFTKNGQATDTIANGGPIAVQHFGRFKYAWMLQRDNNTFRNQVRVQVIVFYNLSTDLANNETVYLGNVQRGSTEVLLTWAGEKPRIRKGGWILDSGRNIPMGDLNGTFFPPNAAAAAPYPALLRGDWYRVIATTEVTNNVNNGALSLELQTPIRRATPGAATAVEPVNIIVMDNVAEVFDRNLISPVSPPQP